MFYSNRLGHISNAQLQAALDQFGLGTMTAAEAIPFGLFGQNLLLTSTAGAFVFRGAAHTAWQLPAERHFAELLQRETRIPVPWPYHFENQNELFTWPWGYAVMPRMPGLALADPNVYDGFTDRQRIALAEAQGAMLVELQQVGWPVAGSYDHDTTTIRPFPGGYIQRTVDRARQLAAQAFANGAHNRADADWLSDWLDECSALPEPERYTVVHEDFSRNNMTATFDGDRAEITGLFDLMTCHFGDGLADLARQFSTYTGDQDEIVLARAFVNAYLTSREPLTLEDVQRTLLYLVDERILVWEYFHRPGHTGGDWGVNESLRQWLERYLGAMESVLS